MATLSISWTIPDAQATAIKDDLAAYLGWTANIVNEQGQTVVNPENQNQFLKRKLGEYVKDCVRTYRVNAAVVTARDSASSDVDSKVSLT